MNLTLQEKINSLLKAKNISGLGDGEKVILTNNFNRLIFLSDNFVSAGKLKRGLEAFGKRIEIISSARESADENDKNLLPFIESVNKYLAGDLDGLIFLPCSAIIKFDKEKMKPFNLKVGDRIELTKLIEILVEMGYERSSLASIHGEFALRGDILDIFLTISEHPVRIEFFDDEI